MPCHQYYFNLASYSLHKLHASLRKWFPPKKQKQKKKKISTQLRVFWVQVHFPTSMQNESRILQRLQNLQKKLDLAYSQNVFAVSTAFPRSNPFPYRNATSCMLRDTVRPARPKNQFGAPLLQKWSHFLFAKKKKKKEKKKIPKDVAF